MSEKETKERVTKRKSFPEFFGKECLMIRKLHRCIRPALLIMLVPVFSNTGCGSSKYTVTFGEYTLPFVTVREADPLRTRGSSPERPKQAKNLDIPAKGR
jgi:hypothetical protein